MSKKTIILALLAVLMFTVQTAVGQDYMCDWRDSIVNHMDTVTIRFELQSKASGEEATLVYPDHLACDQESLEPQTDGEGRWEVKIPAFRTLHVQIWDDNKIQGVVWGAINLFCQPGETVDILLDDVTDRLTVSGHHAKLAEEALLHPLEIKTFHGRMFGMQMEAAAQRIREIYKQNIHDIDTLRRNHPDLPACYTESLTDRARYSYAMDMTQNILGHVMDSLPALIQQSNTLPANYLALLDEVETEELLHHQGPLPVDACRFFSDLCLLHKMKNGIVREMDDDEDEQVLALRWNFDAIETIPADEQIKQQLKIAKALEVIPTPMTMEYIAGQVSDLSLLQMAKARMKEWATVSEPMTEQEQAELEEAPLDSLADGREIFQKLIAPYRGHAIYIDVWGTWCGPCREEMEHMATLHEQLKGMDVVYMSFANNSPKELWQKALAHYHIDGPDHANYNLPKAQQRALEDHLGVKGFPTYIIVAPDGSIAAFDAPRPSQAEEVRNVIQKVKH